MSTYSNRVFQQIEQMRTTRDPQKFASCTKEVIKTLLDAELANDRISMNDAAQILHTAQNWTWEGQPEWKQTGGAIIADYIETSYMR